MSRFRRILDPRYPLHVTGRCNNRSVFPISEKVAWDIFSDHLHIIRGQFDIRIFSFVMMSNHFHLLCMDPNVRLSAAMQYFMRQVSKEMNRVSGRTNRTWGAPYHSSIITNPAHFQYTYKYNYRNPVAAGGCERVEDYQWSTLHSLLGRKTCTIPIEDDHTLFENIEGTLKWLNSSYSEQEAETIGGASRKRIFQIPKCASLRKPFSVPDRIDRGHNAANPGM